MIHSDWEICQGHTQPGSCSKFNTLWGHSLTKNADEKAGPLDRLLLYHLGFQNFVLAGCPHERQSFFIEYGLLAFAPVLTGYETPRLPHANGGVMPDACIKSKVRQRLQYYRRAIIV